MNVGKSSRHMVAVAMANLAPPASALAIAPLLAQGLGVSGRGEVSSATSLLLLFTAVGTLGLPEAVNYFVASRPGKSTKSLRHALWMLLLSGVALTAVSVVLAPTLSGGDSELGDLIIIASLAITPTVMVGALRGLAQGAQRWGAVNAEKYVGSVLRVSAIVTLFVLNELTPLTATLVLTASPILGGFAYVMLASRRKEREYQPVSAMSLARYGALIWAGSLSGVMLSRLDQVLMAPLSGTFQLGLYAVAVSVADLILISNSAIRDVLFSVDAREQNDDRVYLASRVSLLTAVVAGGLIVASVWLWLPWLFGSDFSGAVVPTVILTLGSILGVPGSIGGASLSARGRPGLRSISLLLAAAVNLVSLILLAPALGAVGAALATLIGNAAAANLNLFFLCRHFEMRFGAFYAVRASDGRLLMRVAADILKGRSRK